jgi:hypothetical protein
MTDLKTDLAVFLDSLSNREMYVLRERLALKRMTLDEIGQHFGLTREAIRLEEVKTIKTLDGLLYGANSAKLRADRKADKSLPKFGFPISHVQHYPILVPALEAIADELRSLDTPMVVSAKTFKEMFPTLEGRIDNVGVLVKDFVRAVTHNFEIENGFVYLPSKASVTERIATDFNDFEVGPGLALMSDQGLIASQSLKLLSSKDAANVLQHLGYKVVGANIFAPAIKNYEDAAVAVLTAFDCRVDNKTLMELSAPGANIKGFVQRLAEDVRISRPDPEHFEIARDERKTLQTLHELLQAEVERLGGFAPLSLLSIKLHMLRGGVDVSPNSIYAYANKAPLKLRDGIVYLTAESSRPKKQAIDTKNLYQLANGWRLRLELNTEAMRGSGVPIPGSIVNALKVQLNKPKAFINDVTNESHEIKWSGSQPTMTAVRRIANALGLTTGDTLLIDFLDNGTALCKGVKAPVTGSPETRLRKMLGLSPETDVLNWIAPMIGAKSADKDTIESALRKRFETDTLALVEKLGD